MIIASTVGLTSCRVIVITMNKGEIMKDLFSAEAGFVEDYINKLTRSFQEKAAKDTEGMTEDEKDWYFKNVESEIAVMNGFPDPHEKDREKRMIEAYRAYYMKFAKEYIETEKNK